MHRDEGRLAKMARKYVKSGRPRKHGSGARFVPTEQERKQVLTLAGFGIPHEQIGRLIVRPISRTTLERVFRAELDAGAAQANAKVAESLYLQAIGAPAQYDQDGRLVRAEQSRVPSCGIFWAKARMGWRDVTRIEGSGKDGAFVHQHDLKHLTDAELDALEAIHDKIEAARSLSARSDQSGTTETQH